MTVDDLIAALSDSHVLGTLGISKNDVLRARNDTGLHETLRITYELLGTLLNAGVYDSFVKLPETDQANFLRWVGTTDDAGTRSERIKIFILALELSPLADEDAANEGAVE